LEEAFAITVFLGVGFGLGLGVAFGFGVGLVAGFGVGVDVAVGFGVGKPKPQNYHGDIGNAGVPGDSQGSGLFDADEVAGVVEVMFEFADQRCAPMLEPSRRGADANLDTVITAADIVATIKLVAAAG